VAAEQALQTCHGRTESMAAIREYFAAKGHAHKPAPDETPRRRETPAAIPLCRQCGAHALLAIHEAERGICDWCSPCINDPQPQPNENTA
jgi:hypothetical protein